MSLKVIYGTSGSGKSTYLFNKVAQEMEKSESKIFIITPEQFSFTAEKKLLEVSSKGSSINAEVITFKRMAYRIFGEIGGATKTHLSDVGRAMLIYQLLLEKRNSFKFIGKSEENVEMLVTQFTELKKHGIDSQHFLDATNKINDKYLKAKMQDIATIYEDYTKSIQNNYIDENDILTILGEKLINSTEFKDASFYIDEFVGFTKQEYDIIRVIMKIAKNVSITVCTDNLVEDVENEADVFGANKKTINKIIDMAKQEGLKIDKVLTGGKKIENKYEENEVSTQIQNPRFKNKELMHLEQNIYAPFYKKYDEKVENISLFLANNPYSEIEQIAIKIVKLVQKQSYRYKDISIITKNIDNYSGLCKAIFGMYNIPIFIDEKKDFSQNVLAKFVIAILDIFSKNWSYEAVFTYIKTGFLNLEKEEIALLENYCVKWGIKGSKWYNGEWQFYGENEEEKQRILYSKKIVVDPLIELKKILAGTKTVTDIAKELYKFLVKNEIATKLQLKIDTLNNKGEVELAKEYETSWKVLIDVLDEVVLVLGDKKITFDYFTKLLKIGLNQTGLGKIPGTIDQVNIGDVDRSRSHKVKAVFVIGLNDGVFPAVNKNEGFFDDKDRESLKNYGVELAKGTTEQLYDDNFNIYKAFTTAEEKLYLSYVSSDIEGKPLRPSILINKIKRIFPQISEESDIIERKSEIVLEDTTFDELLINLRNFVEGKEIAPIWFSVFKYYAIYEKEKLENSLKALSYENKPDKIKKNNIERLYGNTLNTSVSRLERYQSCAFSYYLKYGLKLDEKDKLKVESIDTGNFMHEVIDSFFAKLEDDGVRIKEITYEQIQKYATEIIEEKLNLKKYYIFNTIPKYKVLAKRLKRVIVTSLKYIVDSLKYSEFDVLRT